MKRICKIASTALLFVVLVMLGNGMRPKQTERFVWTESLLADSNAASGEAVLTLEKGPHTIELANLRDALVIDYVKLAGEWVEWVVDVPADGLYRIGLRYHQNQVKGYYVTRRVMIDGAAPFAEMDAVKFTYHADWDYMDLGDEAGQPYLFYLTKGQHTLRMQVTLGDMAPLLPGTKQTDGTVDHTSAANGNAAVMLSTCKDPDASASPPPTPPPRLNSSS